MKYLLILLHLVFALSFTEAQTVSPGPPAGYVERLVPAVGTRAPFVAYYPIKLDSVNKHPLFVLLHGIGEQSGRVTLRRLADHNNYTAAERHAAQYGAIIIEPQAAGNWSGGEFEEAYQYHKDSMFKYINWKKVVIAGQSLGGGGVYRYLSINPSAHLLISAAIPTGSGPHQYFVTTANETTLINTKVPIWSFHNKGDSVAPASASTLYFFNKWKSLRGTAKMWVSLHNLNGHTFPAFNRGKGTTLLDGLTYVTGNGYISMPATNVYDWAFAQEIGKPVVAPKVVTVGPGIPTPPPPATIGKLKGIWIGDDPVKPGNLKIEAHYTTGIVPIVSSGTVTNRSVWIPMDTLKSYTPTVTNSLKENFTIPARR
jgi:hypothetical protein